MRKRSYTYWLSVTTALVAATLFGGVYGERVFGSPNEQVIDSRLKEYTEILEATQEWAAENPGADRLVYSSIEGMLGKLDPHSSFLEPRDYSDMQQRQKGTFYGLGIIVTKRNDQVTVITPLEGTPASRLGIRAGDIISEIEGEPTEGMTLDEVVSKLKGPKGTTVNIKIVRYGIDEAIPLSIVRDAIPTNSITNVLMLRDKVGYIRIKDFTYTTVRELDEAIAKLDGEGMEKLILDLRMNPGGLLDAAVGVSDHFIDKGEMIVYTKGRTPDSAEEYRAPGKHDDKVEVPLIVLINRGSASASEIVAGAVQDHDRGLVVGETSWGKGLVQSVYSLQYGAGLALTTSKYYTPSGRNIQRDYTSFYDYYMAEESGESSSGEEQIFNTDTGRKVYASGGITPDVIVKPSELSRTVQILEVRSAIFNFGVSYYAKNPDLTRDIKVTNEIVEQFAQYAIDSGVVPESTLRESLARQEDREYIARALRAEIVAAKFGYDASYPIRLEGDDQVKKALELFPEAQKLSRLSDAVRHGGQPVPALNDRSREALKREH